VPPSGAGPPAAVFGSRGQVVRRSIRVEDDLGRSQFGSSFPARRNAAFRKCGFGSDLVDVRGRGDACADVEELGDAFFSGEEADGALEEGAVGVGDVPDLRGRAEDLSDSGVVVPAARMLPLSTQDRERASWKTCSLLSMTVAGAVW
jgi:hypothetical protein